MTPDDGRCEALEAYLKKITDESSSEAEQPTAGTAGPEPVSSGASSLAPQPLTPPILTSLSEDELKECWLRWRVKIPQVWGAEPRLEALDTLSAESLDPPTELEQWLTEGLLVRDGELFVSEAELAGGHPQVNGRSMELPLPPTQ